MPWYVWVFAWVMVAAPVVAIVVVVALAIRDDRREQRERDAGRDVAYGGYVGTVPRPHAGGEFDAPGARAYAMKARALPVTEEEDAAWAERPASRIARASDALGAQRSNPRMRGM